MRAKIYLTTVLAVAYIIGSGQAQKISNSTIDSLQHFDKSHWLSYANTLNLSSNDVAEFIKAQEKQYVYDTYFPTQKLPPSPATIQQACTNIDFENGTTNGWVLSTGYHPLFNASGCCLTAGGAQTIMSGASVDPCGGFPVVCPGGNFSIRLGNNGSGGIADRMEQKFFVTSANANFTYKYAVVFQDPGHIATQQPAFRIEMFDSLNNAIPCTYYNVASGQNIPGFVSSTNCPGVVYKPWTSVVVDLTSYIGQSVTIRFTTFDCALGGHYGYAYIDGSCVAFQQTTLDTICFGSSKTICAPPGFGSYVWNGGALNNVPGQCVTIGASGIYTVQTTLVTGCQGPQFFYPILNHAKPTANFNVGTNNNICSLSANFVNTSTVASGSITFNSWDFGDGATSSLVNPSHTYLNPGTYLVTLITGSNKGCYDTTANLVTVNPSPIAAFTFSTICEGAPVTYSNTSSISSGTINQWNWLFGDNTPNSYLQNPSHIYNVPGNYTVNFTVTSNMGCTATASQVVTVNAKPNVNFSTSNVCDGNAVTFNNSSTISSGTINNWMWDIDGNSIVDYTSQNVNHTYAGPGTYTVLLSASSNANCINSYSTIVTVYPLPIVAFTANNVCLNAVTSFTNSSSINNGTIQSYNWNFGNSNTTNQASPQVIYTNAGIYNVSLTATSNNNCVATNTLQVSVYPNPTVAFTAPSVCLGNTSSFNNMSSISSGTIINWLWDLNGDNNADSTSMNPTYNYTAAGNQNVSLTAISNNNCVSTTTNNVIVYDLPTVNFTANNSCQGTATSFNNQSTINSGQISSFHWGFGNGSGTIQTNPQIIYFNTGVYQVTLTATSNNNCVASIVHTVEIYPVPTVNFISTTTCLNQATQFTNNSNIIGGTITKYRWDFENNGSWDDSTANPTFIYPNFGTQNCKLQAQSNNNCYSQIINPVIVHGNPVASFKVNSVCLGDNSNFINLSSCADGSITSNQWDFNGDNIVDNYAVSPTHNYATNGVYLAKLEVQSQYGCTNVMSKSVYVNAVPIAKFTANNVSGCPSLCVNFNNLSTISNGTIVTNQWMFGDNSYPGYAVNPVHCYETGNYNVTLKVVSDSGCISQFVSNSLVNVYPGPVAGFNITPNEVDVNQPLIEVTNTAMGAATVSYSFNTGQTYYQPNFTHEFITEEPMQVLVMQVAVNGYGCRDTIVKPIDIKPAFVIWIPNAFTPNSDGLNDGFQAKGVGINKFKMWVFDRWGQVIFETDDINKAWDGTVRGSSEPIKDDVYVWKVQVEDVFRKNHDLAGHVTLLK